ncbi:MAG: hypothetical protein GC161_16565 [Planctomycetaceae bacterium]|nr:hypothetical protein [Planctomycetaceae bacterium]
MRSRTRLGLALGSLAVAAVGLVWASLRASRAPEIARPDEAKVHADGSGKSLVSLPAESTPLDITNGPSPSPSASSTAPSAREALRSETSREPHWVWVRDSAREPVPGATVSLTPLDVDVLGSFPGARASDKLWFWRERGERLAAKTRTATTDWRGAAQIHLGAEGTESESDPTALWVTHPDYTAAVQVSGVSPGSIATDRVHEFTLEGTSRSTVRVLDPSGRAVADASVQHLALLPLDVHPVDAATEMKARRALVRGGTTDSGGMFVLASIPGRQAVLVRAELEGGLHQAIAFLESPPGALDIHLVPTFELSGQVRWSGTQGVGAWGFVSVESLPDVGLRQLLAAAHVAPDGRFGPVQVPLLPSASHFRVSFDHGGLAPREHRLPRPSAGERVWLDLETEVGLALWVQVVAEETDEPLSNVQVILHWNEPPGRTDVWTSAVGWAQFESVPNTDLSLVALKEGYARLDIARLELERVGDEVRPTQVAMVRAGRLTGVVTDGSGPVENFDIIASLSGSGSVALRAPFSGRLDGRFVVDQLEPGDYAVRALIGGVRATEAQNVRIDAEQPADVHLDAAASVEVTGRVLRAQDQRPWEGVQVAAWLADRGRFFVMPVGPTVLTDADGRFLIPAAPAGQSMVQLWGPDGSNLAVPLHASGEARQDLGDLVLRGRTSLLFELVGEPATAEEEFELQGTGLHGTTVLRCNEPTSLSVPDEAQTFSLIYGDGTWDQVPVEDPANRHTPVRFHIRPGRVLVRVNEFEGAAPNERVRHATRFVDPDGVEVLRLGAGDDREWVLPGIPAGRAEFFVFGRESGTSASAVLEVAADGSAEVVLNLSRSGQVRLVDAAGQPLEDAMGQIRGSASGGAGSASAWPARLRFRTLADGLAPVPESARGESFLVEGHTGDGVRFGELLLPSVRAGGDPVDLIVPLDGVLAVDVWEEGVPVVGARLLLWGSIGHTLLGSGNTDSAGRVVFGPAGLGPVRVELTDSRFFAAGRDAVPSSGGAHVVIEAYSRADLELRVVTSSGQPVPGASATLVHRELGTDVLAWIQAGRVHGALTTGANGEINVAGLPRGRYGVAVESPAGSMSGELELKAGKKNALDVVVQ